MPTTSNNQHNRFDKEKRSDDIDEEQLKVMMTQAMRDSLRDKVDSFDNNLIPATESFKGLLFSDD